MSAYLVAALLISSVAAFAPVARPITVAKSLALNAYDAKTMPGNTGPLGFFDPLGLCPDSEKKFKRYRESELKHGRVAMIAVLGVLVGESGFNFFGEDITGPAIFQYQQAEGYFTAWSYNVVGFTATVELFNIITGWESVDEALASSEGKADLKDNYINGKLSSSLHCQKFNRRLPLVDASMAA
jgi:Chlorophyll A-B binding protein